jgi:hypothetical protein
MHIHLSYLQTHLSSSNNPLGKFVNGAYQGISNDALHLSEMSTLFCTDFERLALSQPFLGC